MGEANLQLKPYMVEEENTIQPIMGTFLPLVALTMVMSSLQQSFRYLVFIEIAIAATLLVWYMSKNKAYPWYASVGVVASLFLFALSIYMFSGWY
jgi:hypothetical protein